MLIEQICLALHLEVKENIFVIIIKDDLVNYEDCKKIIKYFEESESKRQELDNFEGEILLLTVYLNNKLNKDALWMTDFMKKIQYHVGRFDSNYNIIEQVEIMKYSTNTSKSFHYDDARDSTTRASVTFLNDDFLGGEVIVEGVTISPKQGRTYFIDGKQYKHGVTNVYKGNRYVLSLWYKAF